jgi:uncharacterized protein (TIGR00290 family)
MKPKALLSWSSGKDSAWALHVLRERGAVEVVGLVTTISEPFGRVAMHGVRTALVQAQADAVGLPLQTIPLPWPCPNQVYEDRMREMVARARAEGVSAFAFGDLFLADIRAYRERQLAGTGVEPLFPLWGSVSDTPALAHDMLAGRLRATVTCVDRRHLPATFAGRTFDADLLNDLPPGVDPCGENGEFHTFCHAGPMFARPIAVRAGAVAERDGFAFADLLPADAGGEQ